MLSGTAHARAGKDYWVVQNSWSANWGNPPTRARAIACTYARATTAHEHAHDTRHSQRLHARRSRRGGAVCAERAGEGGFARIARGKDTMGIESLELLTVHADTTEAFAHSHAALPPAPPLCRYPPPAASPALRSLPLSRPPAASAVTCLQRVVGRLDSALALARRSARSSPPVSTAAALRASAVASAPHRGSARRARTPEPARLTAAHVVVWLRRCCQEPAWHHACLTFCLISPCSERQYCAEAQRVRF